MLIQLIHVIIFITLNMDCSTCNLGINNIFNI